MLTSDEQKYNLFMMFSGSAAASAPERQKAMVPARPHRLLLYLLFLMIISGKSVHAIQKILL